jgi:hypothetical protein
MKKRIVLTTFGSLGDLHPYIAAVPTSWDLIEGDKS